MCKSFRLFNTIGTQAERQIAQGGFLLKILVVCQHYAPEPFRVGDICEALAEKGHQVTVVTGTPNYPEGEIYPGYEGKDHRDEQIGGVQIHRCPLHPRKHGIIHRIWNYYSFVWSSWRYLRKLNKDFDVVFVNQLTPVMMAESALKWAKKHHKRCVLYCLDLWPESLLVGGIKKNSFIYRLYYKISQRIYRQADHILLTSKGFIPYFRDFLRIDENKLDYLPQYAEELFSEVMPKDTHGAPYHFMFAGNVGEFQSVETIVKAAALLQDDPRIHIHIVGDGISAENCQRMAEGLQNITFHGRRPVEEMPQYYAMADAMIVTTKDLPSMEGLLPGKVQSYLAAGKPIVGACGGETADVIADAQCGLCVPSENAAGLAACMQEMVSQPEKLQIYGQFARAYYERYFVKEGFILRLIEQLEKQCSPDKCMRKGTHMALSMDR